MEEWREQNRRPQTARPGPPGPARRQASPRPVLRRMLSSRRTLRQAILLHEVLGPPKGLERQTGETSRFPDNSPPVAIAHDRNGNGMIADHSDSSQQPRAPQPQVNEGPTPAPRRMNTPPRRASGTPSIIGSALSALDVSTRTVRRLFRRLGLGS